MKNYYEILDINKNATEEEIKKAWRDKVRIYAPDKNIGNKGAESKFKEIDEAYKVLGNKNKKKLYDLTLSPITKKKIKSDLPNDFIEPSRIISVNDFIGNFRIIK